MSETNVPTVTDDQIDETVETTETEETTQETLTVEEVVEDLFEKESDEIGAYRIWSLVMATLDVFEYNGKRPTSQYMYNYSRNSMIAKGRGSKNTNHQYTKAEAKAFVTKYVGKKIS